VDLESFFPNGLESHRSRLCLVCPDRGEQTYADVIKKADRIRSQLPGAKQLVFIEAHNAVPSILAYLGALRGGHAVHLIDPDKEADNASLIETYRPNVVIRCDDDSFDIEFRHDQDLGLHPELAILLSTSGSTGSSKLVKLSYENIQSNTDSIVTYLEMHDRDRTVTSLKFHYSYGLSIINSHLAVGGAIVLTDESVQNQAYWDLCSLYRATNFSGVPYTYEIVARLELDFSQFRHFRFLTQAGGKLDSSLVRRFADIGAKHGWKFYVMYGQTEAAPRMAYLPPALAQENPDCIGVAIPGGRLFLADEDHHLFDVAGQEGELVYEGPNVMIGYALSYQDLSTKEHIRRLYTGDMAIRNEEGLYRITGRKGRFVKPFGLRISLDDIQAHLGQQGVRGYVIGRDHQIVVCTEQQDAGEPIVHDLASRYQLPATLFRVQHVDSIPLLSNGKVDYRELEARFLSKAETHGLAGRAIREFLRWFWIEFVSLLIGGAQTWSGTREIFEFHFRGKDVTPDSTFITLGGDSLLYVEMSICLQEYLDHLPRKWQCQSVAELQALAGGASA